ncbi:MAG: type II secretion system minor pseudopilin GspK [Gammaproteobacteria bacterium]|nr:type II secretion system minor pseudopilin GspK [Gammaproteobacteria bacterium]MCH9763809.1 type II secretion system minor pseudopilin GspK [Gammaproteobacteria bacterium]
MLTKRRGSALLSALFIMTLVAIATTTMTLQLKTNLDTTRILFKTAAFHQESIAIRYWAMDFLTHNKSFGHTPGKTTHTEKNIIFPSCPNTHFSSELIDLNARFNINNLKYPNSKTAFFHLARHLLEDTDEKKAYPITIALTTWVSDVKAGHEEKKQPIIAHLPMVSLSELVLVPNINLNALEKIKPYLTALPPKTQVNLNTAPEELLMAMANGPNAVKYMEELITARGKKGIDSLNTVQAILKKLSIQKEDVTTDSTYFLNIGHIQKDMQALTLYSVLERIKNKNGTYTVHLVHETWNTD